MNAVVAAFNQEKALVGALITNLRMQLFEALIQYVTRDTLHAARDTCGGGHVPGPLARILERRVSTCPVLVSHLLASHYSTRCTHTTHLILL